MVTWIIGYLILIVVLLMLIAGGYAKGIHKNVRWAMAGVLALGFVLGWLNTANAATYYVDYTSGDDEAEGTEVAPWKTITKVNAATFASGDSILFKKGETWVGTQLTVPRDSLTFTSYGTGAKPIIDGGDSLHYGIYSSGNSYVTIDGFIIKKFAKTFGVAAVYIYGGSYVSVKNCDISEVYYATNPMLGGVSTAWEAQKGVGIQFSKCNGATISGNTIRDCGSQAMSYSTSDNVSLSNLCEISNNEITNINTGIRITTGNTSGGTAIKNVKIYNNYIHDFNNYYYCDDWHRDGIHVWSTAANATVSIDSLEIYNNYFEDFVNHKTGSTAWLYIEYNCKNFRVHHNIFNQGGCINYIRVKGLTANPTTPGGHEFYNNTIRSILDEDNGTGILINYAVGCKIKNNIFYTQKVAYATPDADSSTGFRADYNVIIRLDGGDDVASAFGGAKTFAELQAVGLETHSINADPIFVGGSGSTAFQLQADSPAIDVGADLGFTTDAAGDTIPQGVAPEIGAFEFSTTPAPPSGAATTAINTSYATITFENSSEEVDGYQITVNGAVIDTVATNTFTISNTKARTKYNIQIKAIKDAYISGAAVVEYTAPGYSMNRPFILPRR